MEHLMAYYLFCATTALMACIYLFGPVMQMVSKSQPLNPVIQHKGISYSVFFLMSFLAAPIIFFSVIIPSFGDRFKHSLCESLEE